MDLLDKFATVIDEFLKENEIIFQVKLPEGSIKPEIRDNTGGGAVMQLYIVLNTLPTILTDLTKNVGELDKEGFLNSVLEMIKAEVLEEGSAE